MSLARAFLQNYRMLLFQSKRGIIVGARIRRQKLDNGGCVSEEVLFPTQTSICPFPEQSY
jgi:hypothetical protein